MKYWWNKKTLKEAYISRAATVQNQYELAEVTPEESLEIVELLEQKAVGTAVRKKAAFRNYLVMAGKAKFGCPVRNESNRLVVRKHLHDLCVDRGLIARHIIDHLDIATELVFIPSREQLIALALPHTELSKIRVGVSNDLGGSQATIA